MSVFRHKRSLSLRRRLQVISAVLAATGIALVCSGSALGAVSWTITSLSNTTVPPGGTLDYRLSARNLGDSGTDGSTITLTAVLPPGLTGLSVTDTTFFWSCPSVAGETTIICTSTGFLGPFTAQQPILRASVDPGASGVRTATFEVEGGGAPAGAHTDDPVVITPVSPEFGVDAFDGAVNADALGAPLTQAGAHPFDVTTSIDFNTYTDPSPVVGPGRAVEPPKTIVVDLPPGFVGDPTGVDECTIPELSNTVSVSPQPLCAPTAQVGVTTLRHASGVLGPYPVFNMVPPPGVPARFGFNAFGTVVLLDAEVRSGDDYGLSVRAKEVSQGLAITGTSLTFWGVPSDPSHDSLRSCPGSPPPSGGGPTCASGAPRKAFFRNPTSCTPPLTGLTTTLRTDSWMDPGDFKEASFVSHLNPGYPLAPTDWGLPQGPDGCERVPFDIVLRGEPVAGAKAGAPSSFTFDVELPQTDDPDSIGQSDLKKAVVTLPEGVRVSPASATGLAGCSSAQIALRSAADPTCPNASRVGTVEIDTPLLDEQVRGGIYLATPFDNPFNSLIAVYLVARARGIVIKLPGDVRLDPRTGQITSTFDNNPQLPFSRLHLVFNGGTRAPLVTPKRCGTYTTHAVLTGWNGRTVVSDRSFTLTENVRGDACPSTFSPAFDAGTTSNSGSTTSSFVLRLSRNDEDQDFRDLVLDLPVGLIAKRAQVRLCSAANASAGRCGEESRIGNVTVGAGAGPDPFFITSGRAYLTEPTSSGATYGLSIVVPAIAGPFNLGEVNVLAALHLNEDTTELRVVTDSFPTILQGVPLDVRDIRVNIDKEGFFLNPTSCAEKTIRGVVESTEGSLANVSSRFQAADCGSLVVKPRMTLQVGGRGRTQRGRTTPLTATLTQPTRWQANLRFVRVTLPTTINARLTVINDACTRAEFAADRCEDARTGTAVVNTPLLPEPLRGGVYFVRNGNPLPDLFIALRGEVKVNVIGKITIPGSKRLRTTFASVPDVPFSKLTLKLDAGRNGSIGNAANLCSARARRAKAELDFRGQNGKVLQVDQRLKVKGCRARRGRASRRGRRARRR